MEMSWRSIVTKPMSNKKKIHIYNAGNFVAFLFTSAVYCSAVQIEQSSSQISSSDLQT